MDRYWYERIVYQREEAHRHRGTSHGLHTLARINLRLVCDCLWYHCCLQNHSGCGTQLLSSLYQTLSSLQSTRWHYALICQAGFLGKPLLPATAKVSSPKAQHRQQGHRPALLYIIKGQRQDRHRNKNRQASVRANKVSNVGRN